MKKKPFLNKQDAAYWKAFGEGQLDKEGGYPAGYAAAIEDVVKLCEPGCLKGCDSYGHEDLCPYVNTLDAIKALLPKGTK